MKFKLVEDFENTITDNQGNDLSQEQLEYFRNTQVKQGDKIMVCVHGSRVSGDLTTLDPNRCNRNNLFFSDNNDVAKHFSYGDNSAIYKCYLNIINPLKLDAQGNFYNEIPFNNEIYHIDDIAEIAKTMHHDGVIVTRVKEASGYLCDDFIVFKANQVKSIYNKKPTSKNGIYEHAILNKEN